MRVKAVRNPLSEVQPISGAHTTHTCVQGAETGKQAAKPTIAWWVLLLSQQMALGLQVTLGVKV